MAFIVTIILGKFVLAVLFAIALWFWQTILGFINFFYNLYQKYVGDIVGLVLLSFFLIFAGAVIMEQFQEPVYQTIDASYNVIILVPAEASISFADSTPRPFYEWVVVRWNDIVYGFGDAFQVLINDLGMLGPFDNTSFYTNIVRSVLKFIETVTLLFFETPSWQLPFGITELTSSFWRQWWCIINAASEFILRIADYTLLRNDPIFCELDPTATCLFRRTPNTFPFLFVDHVPETLMEENCTEGVAIDCDFIACNIRAFANFSVVFTNIPGSPDLPVFFEELIPDICCFVTRSYKVPLWVLQGFLTFCISGFDIPDIIYDELLVEAGSCFIDFFFRISGGTIVNIFIDIFAVIFPFIQIAIDSIVDLIACYATFNSCFQSYPGNCGLSSDGFGNAGLQTCFQMAGECIVNGDGAIDPNPIFSQVPFNILFNQILPSVMIFIDTVVCNAVAFQQCVFISAEFCPSLSNPGSRLICMVNCVRVNVPLVSPLFVVVQISYGRVISAIETLLSGVNDFIEIVNDFCAQIDAISISGVGFPGCHVNEINIPNLMREDGGEEGGDGWEKRGDGKKRNFRSSSTSTGPHWYLLKNRQEEGGEENQTTTFANYTEFLTHYHVNPNTSCGRILYTVAINYDEHHVDVFATVDPGMYISYWICNYLLITGLTNEKKYNGEVKMHNFLDATTMFDEFSTLFECKHKDYMIKLEGTGDANITLRALEMDFANKTYWQLHKFARIDELTEKMGVSTINLDNETALQLWSETVRGSLADSVRTITYGIVERILSHDLSVLTLDYLKLHTIITDVQLKLTGRIPGALLSDGRGKRRRRGDSIQRYIHNYTIADLIPQNDYSVQLMKSELDSLEELYNKSGLFQKGQIERSIQVMRDETYANFVTNVVNYLQALYEEKKMKGVIRNKATRHNNKLGLQGWSEILPDTHQTRVITVEELRNRREHIVEKLTGYQNFLEDLYELGEYFFPDKQSVANIINWPVLNEVSYVPSIHMFLSHDYKSTEFIENYTRYKTGELSYIIEKGFVHPSEHETYKKQTRNTFTVIREFVRWKSGDYNITALRSKPQNTSLFGMDYNAPSKYVNAFRDLWRKLTIENKYRVLQKRGTDLASEEAKVFKIGLDLPSELRTIVEFIEYLINTVIGVPMKIILGVDFNFDLENILCDWIAAFQGEEEVVEAATNIFDFFKRLLLCKLPENINGEEFYKFACFPFLPEALFRNWTIPVGMGNPYFPLQLGIWPDELIARPCVNIFNGESYFWAPFRPSNNCGSMDGQDRPLCGTLNRDWCRREFNTCSDVGFDSPQQSFAWATGILPVLLQEFYTGVAGVVGVSMFLMFLYIHVLNFGSLNFMFVAWLIIPAVLGHYFILNIFDSIFQGLSGVGERGGIPYGFLYILALGILTYMAAPSMQSMPEFVRVFILWGLGFTWIVNLLIPFRGIRTGFTLNQWFAAFFRFLDQTPQFLEFIPMGSLIDAFEQFDYSQKAVPYLDTFCFFGTISNFFAFLIAVILFIDLVTFLIYVFYPTFTFAVALGVAIFQLVTDIRYWLVKQAVKEHDDRLNNLEEEMGKRFVALRLEFNKNMSTLLGKKFPSRRGTGGSTVPEEEFVFSSKNKNKNKNNDEEESVLRRRRRINITGEMLQFRH